MPSIVEQVVTPKLTRQPQWLKSTGVNYKTMCGWPEEIKPLRVRINGAVYVTETTEEWLARIAALGKHPRKRKRHQSTQADMHSAISHREDQHGNQSTRTSTPMEVTT